MVQGYLTHKKQSPLETYSGKSLGPYGGPRGGRRVLMSEVPLYCAGPSRKSEHFPYYAQPGMLGPRSKTANVPLKPLRA